MTPRLALIKLRLRLNKLHSSDYDNIPDWTAIEAVNKAALGWVRRQVHGMNQMREGDEESRMRLDDLQYLLRNRSMKGESAEIYFETDDFPADYLWYKRIIPKVSKGSCQSRIINSDLVEEANVPILLQDEFWKPSFEWEQSFHTLINNKIRVYTNADFNVISIDFVYYRRPVKMDIEGYTHPDGSASKNVDLEFKDDIAELIIDEAASILAGDIESINQVQINKERTELNN